MNPLDKAVGNYLEAIRDARRPPLELVLEVIQDAFSDFQIRTKLVHDGAADGSNMWLWEDTDMKQNQLPKFYVLTTSNSPGLEGYPIFTIRQAYSMKMDTWLTFSSIVAGPGQEGISRSLALLISQHAGAFAGVKYSTSAVAANGGHPHAGLLAVQDLLSMEAPLYDDVNGKVMERLADVPAPKSDREVN